VVDGLGLARADQNLIEQVVVVTSRGLTRGKKGVVYVLPQRAGHREDINRLADTLVEVGVVRARHAGVLRVDDLVELLEVPVEDFELRLLGVQVEVRR
jgi:hypothetical protein